MCGSRLRLWAGTPSIQELEFGKGRPKGFAKEQMPQHDTNSHPLNPNAESDLKRREKQQGLKKDKKSKQVEERPADRVRGEEEGNKSNSPT
jgi:hypothetical protein